MGSEAYHIPVMLQEAIDGLAIDPDGTYVDVTYGGGGHSAEILKSLTNGKLIAFDQDPDALANLPKDSKNFSFVAQNFRYLRNFLRMHKAIPVDGILADLGVSSHQFDEGSRGFSLRAEAALDMRMNPKAGKSAEDIIREYSQEDLATVFRIYGEIKTAWALSQKIKDAYQLGELKTTAQLKSIAAGFAPRNKEHKFLAQVFQALRIEVNQEMDALKEFLEQSAAVLAPGGRLVVISYHSLEDRLVKHFMRSGDFSGEVQRDFFGKAIRPFKPLPGQPIIPSEEEIERNPRARSAKLRVAVKEE